MKELAHLKNKLAEKTEQMLATPTYNSHKRTRLILEMKELFREIKNHEAKAA